MKLSLCSIADNEIHSCCRLPCYTTVSESLSMGQVRNSSCDRLKSLEAEDGLSGIAKVRLF